MDGGGDALEPSRGEIGDSARPLSAAEFLVGAAIVIGHNVFHVVPNEVPILFGYGHYYKGPSGVVDSGVAGLILGTSYLATGRNLWTCILGHGFIDTFAVITARPGWNT